MFKDIIFDLDGTLIDSRPAILDAFDKALSGRKIQPRIALSTVRIGPPLGETLRQLVGDDLSLIDALTNDFKRHYDSAGYRESTVFAGIPELLTALETRLIDCYLATNKRLVPTRLILSHLQWEKHFKAVYALDRQMPPLPDKTRMLAQLLAEYAIDAKRAIYVGDTPEDEAAAVANGLHFIGVTWGYGTFQPTGNPRAADAQSLLDYLSREEG